MIPNKICNAIVRYFTNKEVFVWTSFYNATNAKRYVVCKRCKIKIKKIVIIRDGYGNVTIFVAPFRNFNHNISEWDINKRINDMISTYFYRPNVEMEKENFKIKVVQSTIIDKACADFYKREKNRNRKTTRSCSLFVFNKV